LGSSRRLKKSTQSLFAGAGRLISLPRGESYAPAAGVTKVAETWGKIAGRVRVMHEYPVVRLRPWRGI
jgi:hypothetical protein